ncbi:serine arginine-rich splicing factor [Mortierella alpina]|nr:serine arginine-rich splicing factor [Mortierella alpina]
MSTRVYVGHLSRDATDDDLKHLFHRRGRILGITIKNGFGFVEFENARDAEDAVYEFKGKRFMGESLVVELAREGRPRRDERRDDRYGPPERTEHRLIVENLARGVSWQDIKDFMRKAGEVTFADLSKDFDDQAVVEFATDDDMRYALKSLGGKELRGRPITLRLFDSSKDTAPRDVGRGGGGSGRDRDYARNRDRRDRDFEGGYDRRDRTADNDRDRRNGGFDRYHDRRDRGSESARDDRGVHRRDRRRSRSRSRSRSPRARREHSRHRSRDRRRSPSPEGRGGMGHRRHNRSRSRSRD